MATEDRRAAFAKAAKRLVDASDAVAIDPDTPTEPYVEWCAAADDLKRLLEEAERDATHRPETSRDAFFADVRADPFLHAVTHLSAQTWALAYEKALRDAIDRLLRSGVDDGRTEGVLSALLDERTFDERFEDALAWITENERESRARALVALAELARGVGAGGVA